MEYPWEIICPSNILIVGPSGCGKSCFVEKLIQTPEIWSKPINKIWYCYGIYTINVENIAKNFPHITLIDGLPRNLDNPLEIFNPKDNNLIIFDDLSNQTQKNSILQIY